MTVLSKSEQHVIEHALGLTPRGASHKAGRRWAYRNWLAAGLRDYVPSKIIKRERNL